MTRNETVDPIVDHISDGMKRWTILPANDCLRFKFRLRVGQQKPPYPRPKGRVSDIFDPEDVPMPSNGRSAFVSLSSFILALLLITSLVGCSIAHISKSQKPKTAIGEALASQKGKTERTYLGLQSEVMAFADEYALAVWEGADRVLKRTTDPEKRVLIQYRKSSLVSAAMRIAAGRNPAGNFLDMVVFVTLEHMVVRDYWVPEVYGPESEDLVTLHIRLEKEIWSIAAEMLSPSQLHDLRRMIEEWRAAHSQQHYVIEVRLRNFAELEGRYPGQAQQEINGLMGTVEKSLQKIDEALLMGERAMFYAERMPRILALQADLLTEQLTAKSEIRQLVGDTNQITKSLKDLARTLEILPSKVSAERISIVTEVTEWLNKEHGRVVADLEANEPQVRDILVHSRLALAAGNDLVKSIDALNARLQAQKPKEDNSPPVDYVKLLEKASDTVRNLQELVAMMDAFVAGGKGGDGGARSAGLSKTLNEVNTQTKSVLDHIFLLAAGLILLFLVGLVLALLFYRYLARRLLNVPRASK